MKKSTIKAVIQNKVDSWLASITDKTLAESVRQHVIVTGGCIPSMFLNEKVNDYDVYIDNYDVLLQLAKYYVAQFNAEKGSLKRKGAAAYTPEVREITRPNINGETERRIVIYMQSSGVAGEQQAEQSYSYFESQPETLADQFLARDIADIDSGPEIEDMLKDPVAVAEGFRDDIIKNKRAFKPIFMTDNAITLSDKLQLIIRFYGSPEEIHKNFDYLHATCWYHTKTKELVIPDGALESMLTKQLFYTGSLYPVASVFRMRKFLKRGWNISAGQILKVLSQLSKVDFTNIEMLKEQLAGVDVAYMRDLIEALSSTSERIDATYIAKLVDSIFED